MTGIKAIAFDLDGTIWFGEQVAAGAPELVSYLQGKGIRVFYFTNNSSKSRRQVAEKLTRMGFAPRAGEVYTSAYATAVYAAENGVQDVYCIGSPGLLEELAAHGVQVLDDEEAARALIIGLDVEFNYTRLAKALRLLQRGCPAIACNRDRNYPVENDRLLPGCGAIVAAIEESFGVKVDYAVGKPNTYMMELLSRDWKLANQEILVVGDTYTSDIEMARRFGCPSVLISAEPKPEAAETIVVARLADIRKLI
ncbi:MAG: HAD-IIA family hydrolase [Syntrophomonadaceae bacterium]|nr:HAD-IIA family hydrolase [Syntrophomonadaceae bacterium]